MTTPHEAGRRPRWEIQRLVRSHLDAIPHSQRTAVRLTPYRIAKDLGLPPSSVTTACQALAANGTIKVYGWHPFMVGPMP